jgi:hypothetical protein
MSVNKYNGSKGLVNPAWAAEVYENGWGVPRDYGKAYKWFQKAAERAREVSLPQRHANGMKWCEKIRALFRRTIPTDRARARAGFLTSESGLKRTKPRTLFVRLTR